MKTLGQEAKNWCKIEKIPVANQHFSVTLDTRYIGQNFELQVEFREHDLSLIPVPSEIQKVAEKFNNIHEQYYGFSNNDEQIEVVNIRLTAKGQLDVVPAQKNKRSLTKNLEPIGSRMVWFKHSRAVKTPIYQRKNLGIGAKISGPAIIEQFDSTTVIFPGDELHIDRALNLIIDINLH